MPNVHQVRLEKKITALSDALANLGSADDLRRLILLIRKPGWTTPAEFVFAAGIADTMLSQVAALEQLKGVLVRGGHAVSGVKLAAVRSGRKAS